MKNKNLVKTLLVIFVMQVAITAGAVSHSNKQGIDEVAVMEQTLSDLEQRVLNQQYNRDIITNRVWRLENKIFGRIQAGSLQHRINELIVHEADRAPALPQNSGPGKHNVKITPTTPSTAKQNPANVNKQSPPPQTSQEVIEQTSWDASALLDELLKAQENNDSVSLDQSMAKLCQMPIPDADKSPEKIRSAKASDERGLAAFRQGKIRDALTNFKDAQTLNPWAATILNDLVRAQIKTNDLKAAVLYGPLSILVAPSSPIAWCNMAEIFARVKQYSRAQGCVYLACLMTDDSKQALSAIQDLINNIDEPDVRVPFEQGLFIAKYTLKDYSNSPSSTVKDDRMLGAEADAALYKAHMLLTFASGLQQIKQKTGIISAVTVTDKGQIVKTDLLRSSGNARLDSAVMKALTDAKLPPLPKSIQSNQLQFIVPIDKITQLHASEKNG